MVQQGSDVAEGTEIEYSVASLFHPSFSSLYSLLLPFFLPCSLLPFPFSSCSFPLSLLTPSSLFLLEVGQLNPTRGSGECCELSWWCWILGPGWNRIWCIFALKYNIWRHHFRPTIVDIYAKKLSFLWEGRDRLLAPFVDCATVHYILSPLYCSCGLSIFVSLFNVVELCGTKLLMPSLMPVPICQYCHIVCMLGNCLCFILGLIMILPFLFCNYLLRIYIDQKN